MRMLDLLHPTPLSQSEINDAKVLDVRTYAVCSPAVPPVVSLGGVIVPGRDPEYRRTDHQVLLKPAHRRATWLSVEPEVQKSVKIGQAFGTSVTVS